MTGDGKAFGTSRSEEPGENLAMQFDIRARMQVVTVLALLGLAAVVGLAAHGLHGAVTDARALKTRDLVTAAHGVLAHFESEERAGRMSRQGAQSAAAAALKAMRYAGQEYFFVIDMTPRMVMHPTRPELDGSDLAGRTDPTGKPLFRDMVATVRAAGEGFVPYQWPKPGAEQPADKISYVKGFAPWGWVIGSGVYADDTAAQMRPTMLALLAGLLGTGGLVGGVAFLIGRGISRPALALAEVMGALAAGDLSKDVPATRRGDEIGRMMDATRVFKDGLVRARALEAETASAKAAAEAGRREALRGMADGFDRAVGGIVGSVTSAATELQATAEAMAGMAADTAARSTAVAAAAEQTSANVGTVAAAAEELGASVGEIGRQVDGSAALARLADEEAVRTAAFVRQLAEATDRIGAVADLIAGIAGQTNLLALNATIEAARAGEAGRGFAVVAAEVKALAGQTERATAEIGGEIARIQDATAQAVIAIEGIGTRVHELNGVSASIAAAVEQQGAATREIVRNVAQAAAGTGEVTGNISGVAHAAENTGTAAGRVLGSASDLTRQSERLRAEVARFLETVRAA